jgi:transcriptional regulator with XRE-family HTH domain
MMVGEKIREIRRSQGRSLAEVAGKAKISVATLSRIETDKQAFDVELLLVLSGVLGIQPADVLSASHDGGDVLAQRIASLDVGSRTELWRDLASERRAQRAKNRAAAANLTVQVEELLAQLDFVREELETMRARIKKSR